MLICRIKYIGYGINTNVMLLATRSMTLIEQNAFHYPFKAAIF